MAVRVYVLRSFFPTALKLSFRTPSRIPVAFDNLHLTPYANHYTPIGANCKQSLTASVTASERVAGQRTSWIGVGRSGWREEDASGTAPPGTSPELLGAGPAYLLIRPGGSLFQSSWGSIQVLSFDAAAHSSRGRPHGLAGSVSANSSSHTGSLNRLYSPAYSTIHFWNPGSSSARVAASLIGRAFVASTASRR